jgi:hypothetical protein
MGRSAEGYRTAWRSERRLRLARVEPFLELASDELAAREHVLEAHSPRRQLHDPHVVVAVAVAAGVRRGLIEDPQAVTLPPTPHDAGCLAERGPERNPARAGGSLFATKTTFACDQRY